MNKDIKEIKSGFGLGILKFGMYREDIRELLGDPNDIEIYSYSETEENLTESWHYFDLELSCGFDQEEDWRLVTLSITSDYYQFHNKSLIGLNQNELISELKNLKINDLEFEDWSSKENPDYKLVTSDSIGIKFWFDKGILSEVQWVPLFIDDETINWPE